VNISALTFSMSSKTSFTVIKSKIVNFVNSTQNSIKSSAKGAKEDSSWWIEYV
jgi:hypothetical protein